MNEYYVFNTEEEALAAEQDISIIGQVPIVGTNAKTGEPNPNAQKVLRWAIPQQRVTDNKWVFPRPGADLIGNADPAAVEAFQNNHSYTLEKYDPSWFSAEEMP